MDQMKKGPSQCFFQETVQASTYLMRFCNFCDPLTKLYKTVSLPHFVIYLFLHVSQLTVLLPSLSIQQRLECETYIRSSQRPILGKYFL